MSAKCYLQCLQKRQQLLVFLSFCFACFLLFTSFYITNFFFAKICGRPGSASGGARRRPPPARPAHDEASEKRAATAAGAISCCTRWGIGQILQGSFSAVSKPKFARKYAFESSRRDLHNAPFCTALRSQFFVKNLPIFC